MRLKYLAAAGAGALALLPVTVSAAPSWEQWQSVKGIVDVDGPRSDGTLLVTGTASLFLVDPNGTQTAFATGPGGYHDVRTGEQYVAVSRGGSVQTAGCSFNPDETFILRLRVPQGLVRISADGEDSGSFANIPGPTALDGIAFDNTGSFDHRLLVTGPNGSKSEVFAVDCTGAVTLVTRTAPTFEGGLAVAPSTFGAYSGDLIAPDELSGKIYAISPSGGTALIARPSLPTGGDVGVESLGFVPPGFLSRGGYVYYSDRLTPGNPHPGTDSLLRLSSSDISAAGVQEGDLLVATEGGARLVAVRCATTCTVIPVVSTATTAHGEGHLAFTVTPPPSSPSPVRAAATPAPLISPAFVDFAGTWGVPLVVASALLVVAIAAVVGASRRRGR